MAPLFAIIPYALLETFFCIPILPKTDSFGYLIFCCHGVATAYDHLYL
jgi:hypothetical protein